MSFLKRIIDAKRLEVKRLKKRFSYDSFAESPFWNKINLPLRTMLLQNKGLKIIAEIKKASPSKGVLDKDFNFIEIAEDYFSAGADALSILTDSKFFGGSISMLNQIAKFKKAPLLRKDFIIDEFQIYEAKANGADAVLLIAEALDKAQLNDLTEAALAVGLDVLLELHAKDQLTKIDFNRPIIIGINNRNLQTFEVDLNASQELKKLIPKGLPVISESGIKNARDVKFIKNLGFYGILVGESLIRAANRRQKLQELKTAGVK